MSAASILAGIQPSRDETSPFLEEDGPGSDPSSPEARALIMRDWAGAGGPSSARQLRRRAAAAVSLLALAGVCCWGGWWGLRQDQKGAAPEDFYQYVLVADNSTTSQPVGGPHSTTTLLLKAESVVALTQEAEALRAKAQETKVDAQVLRYMALRETASMADLEKEADAQIADAKAISKAAKMKRAAAQENLQDAKVVNATAREEVIAADALRKQAEWEMHGADAMTKKAEGSHVAEAITSMAKTQRDAAMNAKAQADKQAHAAHAMALKAMTMEKKAKEDIEVSGIILGMVRQEANSTSVIRGKAKAWAGTIHNISVAAEAMEQEAQKDVDRADDVMGVAAQNSAALVDSMHDKGEAQKMVGQANETYAKARAQLQEARNMSLTANKSMASASQVTRQIKVQMGAIENMSAQAEGMSNAKAIKGLAKSQRAAVDRVEEEALREVQQAQQLKKKSITLQTKAEQAILTAHDDQAAAQKKVAAAETVRDKLDSPALIEKAAMDSVKIMKAAADTDVASAAALEALAQQAEASGKDLSETASDAIARGKAMLQTRGFEDDAAQKAVTEMSRQVVAAADAVKVQADKGTSNIRNITEQAKELRLRAKDRIHEAQHSEQQVLLAAEAGRICVDMPGARLKGTNAVDFQTVVEASNLAGQSPEECTRKCRQHSSCAMAIFAAGNKGCYLFDHAAPEVLEFEDGGFNSSYCGPEEAKDSMMAMLHQVFAQKPYIPPPVQCSWAGEDCSSTQCCNNVDCKWDFSKCTGYKCYRKDASFAGCKPSPPAGWDGTVLGGQRAPREVAKAKEGLLVQGTSLFCLTVVMWHAGKVKPFYDTEADIVNNWKSKGLGIMKCDDHMILSGNQAPVASWGSYSNIDAFIKTWDQVKQDGRYRQHDWVVKVDPDAVFFPDRLKAHLHGLRTPQGSAVYLLNNKFRFQFMGALEVMTRQAVDRYFENADTCSRGGAHTGGEDYYMKQCLNAIGVDYQTDYMLLHDKYAEQDDGCSNGWFVAFHFFKKVSSWNACHQESLSGGAVR